MHNHAWSLDCYFSMFVTLCLCQTYSISCYLSLDRPSLLTSNEYTTYTWLSCSGVFSSCFDISRNASHPHDSEESHRTLILCHTSHVTYHSSVCVRISELYYVSSHSWTRHNSFVFVYSVARPVFNDICTLSSFIKLRFKFPLYITFYSKAQK